MTDLLLEDTFTIGCIENCHEWVIKPLGHFSDIGTMWKFLNNTILKEEWVRHYQEFYILHDVNKNKQTVPRVETMSHMYPEIAEIIFDIKLKHMSYQDLMEIYQEIALWLVGSNQENSEKIIGVLMKKEYKSSGNIIAEIRIWVYGDKWSQKSKIIINEIKDDFLKCLHELNYKSKITIEIRQQLPFEVRKRRGTKKLHIEDTIINV